MHGTSVLLHGWNIPSLENVWCFRALKFAQRSINVINLVEITLVFEPKGRLFSFALRFPPVLLLVLNLLGNLYI